MGFFDMLRKQFLDVIEWVEDSDQVLAQRFPMEDREIQNGAQLTVRETQAALFVNEGELADVFEPGRHQLTTQTLPVLTSLNNWDKLFSSPFKSDVYFFSIREHLDQRWGTPSAIAVRDKDYGAIRIRAHGTYSYCIKNPKTFFTKVMGTRERVETQDLEGQMRASILTKLATVLGSTPIAFLEMAGSQERFSQALKGQLEPAFADYGLELRSFWVQSISLPEELQAYLDKATSIKMVGELKQYTQFQAADSIGVAAQHEGGAAGAGAGLGAGLAIGQTMAAAFNQGTGATVSEDPLATINRLHELMKSGAITQAEFDAKKAELLKKVQ